MNKFIQYCITLSFALLVFNGCTNTYSTLTNTEQNFPETNAKNVIITTEDSLPKPFEEVGYISTTQTNIDVAKDKLKQVAAKMGGDAVLKFKVNIVRDYIIIIIIPIPVDHYICRGMVVKYI